MGSLRIEIEFLVSLNNNIYLLKTLWIFLGGQGVAEAWDWDPPQGKIEQLNGLLNQSLVDLLYEPIHMDRDWSWDSPVE